MRRLAEMYMSNMQHIYAHATPLDHASIARTLADLFDFGFVGEMTLVHGGYASDNFRVETSAGSLFLKRYRNRISTVVDEIKMTERYFAAEGIPVLLPLVDTYGRGAFWHEGHWFSVFPWVDGVCPSVGNIRPETVSSLGRMLGSLHEAGSRFDAHGFQTLRLWDGHRFGFEVVELVRRLSRMEERSPVHERMVDVIQKKQAYVAAHPLRPDVLAVGPTALLHGDFIPQNVFLNAHGDVEWVFDFEKTCVGPRAYELSRSLLITCFDSGWDTEAFARARVFLGAYRERQPIEDSEVDRGIRLYAMNLAHMVWMEAKFVLYGLTLDQKIYEQHANRFEHLSTQVDEVIAELLSEH